MQEKQWSTDALLRINQAIFVVIIVIVTYCRVVQLLCKVTYEQLIWPRHLKFIPVSAAQIIKQLGLFQHPLFPRNGMVIHKFPVTVFCWYHFLQLGGERRHGGKVVVERNNAMTWPCMSQTLTLRPEVSQPNYYDTPPPVLRNE